MGLRSIINGAISGSSSGRNWFGGALNDITGKTQSAKQQYKHQLALQNDAQEFSKWQMANAHQMEVEDLKKAGLNPALSAGGGGASAGVSIGSASDGGAGINPLAMIEQAVNSMNSAKMTNAQTEKLQADIKNETAKTQADVAKALAEAGYKQHEIDYYVEHGVFPGATNTVSESGGGLGFNYSNSITTPIGLKTPKKNNAKDLNNNKLPKPPKAMSGYQYRRWLKKQGYKIN